MPYNPHEARDSRGRWTSGGETTADRYARTFYPDHPTDRDIRLQKVAGTAPLKPGRDLTPVEGQEIVGKAKGWERTPYAPADTPKAGPQAVKGPDGGADCSGSVNKIYGESGHPYPYTSSGDFPGAAERGRIPFREVDPKDRQPGDVVVYDGRNHMAIYAGSGDVYFAHRKNGPPFGRAPAGRFQGRQRCFRYQETGRQA